MNIIVLIIYFFICLIVYFIYRFLFKNRFISYYQVDNVLDTDEETYIKYETEERYQKYISEYSVYSNGKERFAVVELLDNVEYINFELVCYKNKKVLSVIKLLKDNPKKDLINDNFTVKLPDACTEIKLIINEANGEFFEAPTFLKTKGLFWKSILSSALFSISSLLIIFLFKSLVSLSFNNFFDWNHIYSVIYNENFIFIITCIIILPLAIIFFISSFVPNTIKYKKLKFNKIKKKKIEKCIKFKLKHSINKKVDLYYLKIKKKKRLKFNNGVLEVIIHYEDGSKETKKFNLNKKSKKILLTTKLVIVKVETRFIRAEFKKLYFYNNKFRKKLTKKGIDGHILKLKGIKLTSLLFVISIVITSSFIFYKYDSITQVNDNLTHFVFEFNDSETKDSYKITSYNGRNSIIAIPTQFNDIPITKIDSYAFSNNTHIEELYMDSSLEIEDFAFSGCNNLRKVQLTNVTKVGTGAFFNTNLESINLDHEMTIGSNAFGSIKNLNEIMVTESANVTIDDFAFKNSHTKFLVLHLNEATIYHSSFTNLTVDLGYVYANSYIDESNLRTYIASINVYVESDCVHSSKTFTFYNGKIVHERSYDLIAIIEEPTCVNMGTKRVRCKYCGEEYLVGIAADPSAHEYHDGYCIYCGEKDPTYVEEGEN